MINDSSSIVEHYSFFPQIEFNRSNIFKFISILCKFISVFRRFLVVKNSLLDTILTKQQVIFLERGSLVIFLDGREIIKDSWQWDPNWLISQFCYTRNWYE